MRAERCAWLGNIIMSGVAIALAVVPLIPTLGKWAVVGVAALMIVAALLLFPYKSDGIGGTPSRLVNVIRIRGNGNQVASGGDGAQINQAGRNLTVNGESNRA